MQKNIDALYALMLAGKKDVARALLDTMRGSEAAQVYKRASELVAKAGAPALANIFS